MWSLWSVTVMPSAERVAKEVALEKELEAAQRAADAEAVREEVRRRKEGACNSHTPSLLPQ